MTAEDTTLQSAEDFTTCRVQKWVRPVVRCAFDPDLWGLGPTCITVHLFNDTARKNLVCKPAPVSVEESVHKLCKDARNDTTMQCNQIAITY